MTETSLLFHHEKKYCLIAWVVMPNHLHFLATPLANVELREIAHSIKSYTAHEANKMLNRDGQFWQHEPFDRYIRNQKHFANVIEYIENNPVKAGLCDKPENWRFSSAFHKKVTDWNAATRAQASRLPAAREAIPQRRVEEEAFR